MAVWLVAFFNCRLGDVNRIRVRVAVADLLRDEVLDKRPALTRIKLSGQSYFNLSVRRTVGPLVLVSSPPKNPRFVLGPLGHVAGCFVFEVFEFARALGQFWRIFAFALDVIRVLPRAAFASGFYCAMVACHLALGVCFGVAT